jgi:hypothetical protein
MTREIEIEISNQSDVISSNILNEKKRDVDKLIHDLSSISSNYISISVSSRDSISHERLQLKSQTSFSLFILFFCFILLQIMIKHINIKINLKRFEVIDQARSWKESTSIEIEAFVEILLYMNLCLMSRIIDYWNYHTSRFIHIMIINCMSCKRWKQIKRFLKIFNLIDDQKVNTRDFHWWTKLEFLITDFRIVSKKYWTSDSHVSIDEQLIDFRERSVHTMQLVCKTAEVNFKLYSLCQKNYLIDFLFTFKIWSQNMKNRVWKADILTQKVKISELKTTNQLNFSIIKWKFTSSFLMIIQLCKSLSSDLDFVLFTNNFFTNARLFKVLRMRSIEICDTIKIDNDYFIKLMRIRAAVIKQKDWDKMSLMIVKSDKKMNIDNEDVLCMTWMNNNIVQYMIIIHTIDEMKKMIYRDAKCRNEVLKSMICDEKLSFSTSIVEYNQHMSESNENAQQRTYYSSHRFDSRYWWSLFIFLLNAIVLNAYKLWDRLYSDFKLTHAKFQHQIAKTFLLKEATRKVSSALSILTSQEEDNSSFCEWKHLDKKIYCELCRKQKIEFRKRRVLEKISENIIKRQRTLQTRWQCKSHDLCCKKKDCWRILHDSLKK